MLIGGLIGLVAGATGGWVDTLLMRFTDIFLALPGPVLAIAVVAALGPSLWHTLIAVTIVWWPFYARIVRGEVRALAARPHIEAARLAGVGPVPAGVPPPAARRGARRPSSPPASTSARSSSRSSSLSFLGLGAPAPAPELGAMSARGLDYLLEYWWMPVMPGARRVRRSPSSPTSPATALAT